MLAGGAMIIEGIVLLVSKKKNADTQESAAQ